MQHDDIVDLDEVVVSFTCAQAAVLLGINVQGVRRLIRLGRLNARRHSHSYVVTSTDLDEYRIKYPKKGI